LTAILAVAVGMLGFNGAFGDTFGFYSSPEIATNDGQAYKGHIIVKHFDAEGNLLGYQQTDNTVTFTGKNCSANLIFGTGFAICASPALFNDIAISLDTLLDAGEADDTAIVLAGECDGTTDVCGAGLDGRQIGSISADTVAAAGVDAIAQIQATFQKTDAGSITIESAGLFDATATETGNVFAVRAFSVGVILAQNDSLQVTWLITLA